MIKMFYIPEFVKVFGCIILFVIVYGFIQDEDYHLKFDKHPVVRYNCDILLGGWHPDVPVNVIDECRKLKGMNVKSY